TLVWDDLHPSQRISVFDRGVEISTAEDQDADTQRRIAYRIGDMVAPALREREALASMFDEFVAAIRENRQPLTDGHAGLRVLHLLEAARCSMADGGRSVLLEEANS
ncbi:MAG: gfo/Idh/MocA family oxidoreductase, partial [Acidimicrobiales bacterium]